MVAASKMDDKNSKQLLRLLLAVREEVLTAAAARLPPDVQVMEALTDASSPEERRAVLVEVWESEQASRLPKLERENRPPPSFPGASLEGVENAASRLLERMEDTDAVVVDVTLLARTALAREAARDAVEAAVGGGRVPPSVELSPDARARTQKVVTGAFPPSQLPRWEAALLKELVTVGDSTVRSGLMRHALSEALLQGNNPDVSAARGGMRPMGSRPQGVGGPKEGGNPEGPPPVRPGRLLDTITNLRADIANADGYDTVAQLREDPIARRAEKIKEELLVVLQDMAGFK